MGNYELPDLLTGRLRRNEEGRPRSVPSAGTANAIKPPSTA